MMISIWLIMSSVFDESSGTEADKDLMLYQYLLIFAIPGKQGRLMLKSRIAAISQDMYGNLFVINIAYIIIDKVAV